MKKEEEEWTAVLMMLMLMMMRRIAVEGRTTILIYTNCRLFVPRTPNIMRWTCHYGPLSPVQRKDGSETLGSLTMVASKPEKHITARLHSRDNPLAKTRRHRLPKELHEHSLAVKQNA